MSILVIDTLEATGQIGAIRVRAELTDGRGDPVTGYVDGTDGVLVLGSVSTTDSDGHVEIELIPNDDILPANSCYTITVGPKSFLIQKSGATQNLFEAIVADPGPLDPISTDFLIKTNNLSDVSDAETSRDNLGLGNSAVLDVGTLVDTVAAGNDPRFDTIVTDHSGLTGLTDPDSHPATAISAVPTGFLTGTDVQSELVELTMGLTAHIDEPVGAHAATAISFAPTVSIPSDDVQEAIEFVMANATGGEGTTDHNLLTNRDAANQHPATSVDYDAAGTLSGGTVQDGLYELDGDIQGHITDATAAHAATAISAAPFATIASTTVQQQLIDVYDAATAGLDEASEISFVPTGDIVATNVQDAVMEVDGELHAHETDATDAHAASAISVVPSGDLGSTDVQSALVELQGDIDADEAALAAHLADTVDAHDATAISFVPFSTIAATTVQAAIEEVFTEAAGGTPAASSVTFTPTGDIAATNVQDAIVEVDTELHAHETDTTAAHAATAVSFTPASGIAATTVQAAIVEALTDSEAYSDTNLNAHLSDTTNAHLASSIGFSPTGSLSSTTAQAAIAEVSGDIDGHIANPTAAHAATALSFTPTGTIAANTVQAAVAEVATDAATALTGHTGASSGAHAATAIGFAPTGTIAATTVQAAVAEVATDAVALYVPKGGNYSPGSLVFFSGTTGDTGTRFQQFANGRMGWADGTNPVDTYIERGSAGVMLANGIIQANLSTTAGGFRQGATGPLWVAGTATPEAAVTAPIGSMFSRTDGSSNTTLYVKEAGTGNTGWKPLDPNAYVSTTAPPGTPDTGDFWFDTDEPNPTTDATNTVFTPAGDIVATNVQAAIVEVDAEFHAHEVKTPGAHAASAISFTPTGTLLSTTAQAAIAEASGGKELLYSQITSSVTLTSTVEATSTTVIAGSSITYDGQPVLIEFFTQQFFMPVGASSDTILINLWDGSTNLGYMGQFLSQVPAVNYLMSSTLSRRIVPSAGSHSYSIRGHSSFGTSVIGAGAGGSAGVVAPAFLRITKV